MIHTTQKYIVLILVAAVLSSSAFFFFPSVKEQELSMSLALAFFSTITLLCAAWYFLSSVKTFKVGLKVAYYLLAAGIIFHCLVLAQYYLTLFVELSTFVRNASFLIPYGVTSVFAYLGVRKFASLLKMERSIWTSMWFVLAIATVAALITTRLPHPPELVAPELGLSEMTLDLVMAVLVWCSVFAAAAAVVALHVRRAISQTYKSAMGWTAAAFLVLAGSAAHELIVKIYFFDSSYTASDYTSLPFVLTALLLLRAGLAFKATQKQTLHLPLDASYIDVVVTAAGLISRPDVIDTELDTLRNITAANPDPKTLSAQDKAKLVKLYLYLEDYLVDQEALSAFTREGLRTNLPEVFAADVAKQSGSAQATPAEAQAPTQA